MKTTNTTRGPQPSRSFTARVAGFCFRHKWYVLAAWLVVIVMLTLATLRLPIAYTAVFFLVYLALLLVFLSVNETSAGLAKAAGYVVLLFAAVGVYLYFSTASVATGGRSLPLGRPALHD